MADRHTWRRADVALACLITLATIAAWLTLILSETGLESAVALVVAVCRRTLDETLAHRGELGRLALLLPLGLGLVLAVGETFRLMSFTRHWMATLVNVQRTLPKRLRHLARICGLRQRIILIQTSRPLVFTHGLLHPRVWLSTGLLEILANDELESVLRHEAHHVPRERHRRRIAIRRDLPDLIGHGVPAFSVRSFSGLGASSFAFEPVVCVWACCMPDFSPGGFSITGSRTVK